MGWVGGGQTHPRAHAGVGAAAREPEAQEQPAKALQGVLVMAKTV